jgi:hypothetical protein
MKKTILEIYALAVCFVAVICFVVCLGIAGYGLIQFQKPDFTLSSYQYDTYQDNDAYWRGGRIDSYCADDEKGKVRPSEDELTKQRVARFGHVLASEQRDGLQNLVKAFLVIFVDALAFMVHWGIARRARMNAPA